MVPALRMHVAYGFLRMVKDIEVCTKPDVYTLDDGSHALNDLLEWGDYDPFSVWKQGLVERQPRMYPIMERDILDW